MMDILYAVDVAVFKFCNQTIANPLFDWLMPFLTDLNKHWWGLALFALCWLALFVKGGKKGRIVATLLLFLIVLTDQINSTILKSLFGRLRPCAEVAGAAVLSDIRLLVDCGSGYSFPSSHAANNFGAAFLLSFFYRSWSVAFYSFAGAVAFSRISVGVHYPSDVVGGIAVGAACAGIVILGWMLLASHVPRLDYDPLVSSANSGSGEP